MVPNRCAPRVAAVVLAAALAASAAAVEGELKQWHTVTLTFDGPSTGETAAPNPFTDYRLDVTFTLGSRSVRVPGYYAADGDAADTGAAAGAKWRVHFVPDATGTWTWKAGFRKGTNVAMSTDPAAGTGAGHFDGTGGSFVIAATDKTGRDFRGKGRLRYAGEHYLRHANGEWFLKVGPDSPEGFLANPDIDCEDPAGTRSSFSSHGQHWAAGDPSWKGGKGKNAVGAVNYVSGKGMNCFYLLTYTGHGDTGSVWPYRRVDDRTRFDCSKLDQWEILLAHMDRKGILQHLVLSETENETYWEVKDGVSPFAPSRKLYYREMIARFGHHLGVVWNLGEEIGWSDSKGGELGKATTDAQRKAFASFIRDLDPYGSPVVCHTLPGGSWDSVYGPLLGYGDFEGISGQFTLNTNGMGTAHEIIKAWVDKSAQAGRKWEVCNDEPGGENIPLQYDASGNRLDTAGVRPDALDAGHDYPRKWALWGTLMAGGAGLETYFGWGYTSYGGGDGSVSNYAAWTNWWDQCRHAHQFFVQHLPFHQMHHDDGLTSATNDFCFAKRGTVYAIYLREGCTTSLDLAGASGTFEVKWHDPRAGGALKDGSVKTVQGGAARAIGNAPYDGARDWAVLVRKAAAANQPPAVSFAAPANGASFSPGTDLAVTVNASDPDGSVSGVKLYVNGQLVRQESQAPYEWGAAGQDDLPLQDLAAGTYALRAEATDNTGAAAEASISVRVEVPLPAAPSGLSAAVLSASQIRLSWADNASNEGGFKVERKTGSGGTYAQVATAGANATGWTDSGLSAGALYYYRVRAYNAGGNSAYSNEASAATPQAVQAVTGLTLVNADTDADIGPLADGAELDLETLPTRNLNVRANTSPAAVGSVKFAYDGNAAYRIENGAPYALAGNDGADYSPWTPAAGSHAVTATPYSGADATGAAGTVLKVSFTVTGSAVLPSPWLTRDIGAAGIAGSARYAQGIFEVHGSGADIWGGADEFRFVYQAMAGDGEIRARVASIESTHAWAKAGVMVRETLDAGSRHAMMALTPGNGLAFQRRTAAGGASAGTSGGSAAAPAWIRVVRQGNNLTGYASADGLAWTWVATETIPMAAATSMGLAVTSHADGTLCAARFDNVGVAEAPPPSLTGLVKIAGVSTNRPYSLAPMQAGALTHIDRSYGVIALSAGLVGGVLVRTAMDDKYATAATHLTLTLGQEAYVHVCYDGRGTLPGWLAGWTPTPESVVSTDGGASPMRAYGKAAAAGSLVLGGNLASPAGGAQANYIVVVRPAGLAKAVTTASGAEFEEGPIPADRWQGEGDGDGDGLKDDFEPANGLDPMAADTDGDGVPDEAETLPDGRTLWEAQGDLSAGAAGEDGDGGCGAMGIDLLLWPGLFWAWRRRRRHN